MTSVAVAGGGERVVAWEIGVPAGFADAGLDLRGAVRIVGTSAGALVAARLAAGEDPSRPPPGSPVLSARRSSAVARRAARRRPPGAC